VATTVIKPAPPGVVTSSLIMPFVRSTMQVFTQMVKIQPTIAKPHLKTDSGASYDVSGIIGFSGEIVGSVVVSFEIAAAQKLVSALVGMDIDADAPDFVDAIGELANMIAGSAKKELGRNSNITVPTVIIGKGHMIGRLSGVPCMVIPCHTPVGDFAVEVNIKPTV
jgi:chemotaxis protein CheX